MAVIAPRDLDRVLAPDSNFRIFLFHGDDPGLVHEGAKRAVLTHTPDLTDPFSLARLTADTLAADPGLLADETNSLGLFSQKRTVWVDVGGHSSLPGLDAIEPERWEGVRLVFEAAGLRRDSLLRKYAEQSRVAAAIECNAPDAKALLALVDETLATNGLNLEPQAKAALIDLLPEGWLSSRSELEKLTLFAEGRKSVSLTEVYELIGGGRDIGPDDVVEAAFQGDFPALQRAWDRACALGEDGGVVLGFALRRILFRRPGQSRALDAVGPEVLRELIKILADAIRDTRRESRLAQQIAQRAFWSVAHRFRRA